ncbi:MAG: HigA family addiction module antitoxin [Vampirovibrionales bacterium]|nr:HigA family addiction module antitoxin [Vampirovibrionales bacterium]
MSKFLLPGNQPPVHPGEMLLEEFLKPANISQRSFAAHIGWTTARLSELINGKRGLSYEAALDLADVFQMEVQFWLNLQAAFELWHARRKHKTKKPLNISKVS